jgi:hypothetical protein
MARIENINGNNYINLNASVGQGGVNLSSDVMVVQALIKFNYEELRIWVGKSPCPEPNGRMSEQWIEIIKDYQRYLKTQKGFRIAVDGRVNRAMGNVAFGKRGDWTILCMNRHLVEIRLLKGDDPYGNEFAFLCRRFPQLHALLEIPVGELHLILEGAPRVGSMNLALE